MAEQPKEFAADKFDEKSEGDDARLKASEIVRRVRLRDDMRRGREPRTADNMQDLERGDVDP